MLTGNDSDHLVEQPNRTRTSITTETQRGIMFESFRGLRLNESGRPEIESNR
jgi:hypothetical protein